jgi:hypothetical protein
VAEFDALARRKLGECYGALRGLVSGPADEAEAGMGAIKGARPEGGAPCPACGLPLAWARVSRAELDDMRGVTGHPLSRATAPPPPREVGS